VCQLSCPYENAFWDGYQMVFGAGFASADDVVGHELTHGVTQYTSDLYYYSESGGINEAMSDIMGEFIDQTRQGTDDDSQWNIGEDLPASVGVIRSMKSPTLYGVPDYKYSPEWSDWYYDSRDNYGVHGLGGPVEKAAYLFAQTGTVSFRGETITGIGIPKSAQIWYRLEFMLPSGAELDDLGVLLPQACLSLVGVKGITAADCAQVDKAVRATDLTAHPYDEAQLCPIAGQPVVNLISEDFENGTSHWKLGGTWQNIPSVATPVSWANSGKHALYGSTNAGVAGGLAVLKDPITIRPGSVTYLWYASNVPTQGGGAVLVNTGSPDNTGGWTQSGLVLQEGNGSVNNTLGYDSVRFQLSALQGQTIHLALQASTPQVGHSDWLVDDIRVYECSSELNGEPQKLSGLLANGRTGGSISWAAPLWQAAPVGVTGYEISVSPPIAGQTFPVTVSPATLSYAFTGLDPAVNYTVFVRATGQNGFGPAARLFLGSDPFLDCHKYVFDPTLGRPLPPWPCPATPAPSR
jgi:hypothetical protein